MSKYQKLKIGAIIWTMIFIITAVTFIPRWKDCIQRGKEENRLKQEQLEWILKMEELEAKLEDLQ